jgi:hypothetical protein
MTPLLYNICIGGVSMSEKKAVTVRIELEKWKIARKMMIDNSDSFQKVLEKAIDDYIEKKR